MTLPLTAGEVRTWTSAGGRTAEGELVSKSEKSVKVRLTNGAEADIEIATLSVEDQQYIKDWKPTEPPRPIYVPEDAAFYNGSWYKVILEKTSWTDARAKAEKMEGHLAWSKNLETQDFLTELAENLRLWLGATDEEVEGLWRWTDGEKFSYLNWKKGFPDNDRRREHYLIIGVGGGGWNDMGNNSGDPVGYIVQWDR